VASLRRTGAIRTARRSQACRRATAHRALLRRLRQRRDTRTGTRTRDFLDAWLRALRNVEIDLIAFRNEVDAPQRFTIRDGDARALRAAIEALPLDGASAYGALRIDAAALPDLLLVIGDGLSNFGSGEPQLRTDGSAALGLA
jgi:hypothetical protein